MELIHTLLFMLREETLERDLKLAKRCLTTLEKCTHKDVLVYNQGFWSNGELENYLKNYSGLNFTVIGKGENVGILNGRQECFENVWNAFKPDFISELHLDMAFVHNWEDHLINALNAYESEPLMSSGIIDKNGWVHFREDFAGLPPEDFDELDKFLDGLRRKAMVDGFTHPCIHRSQMLKSVGGINRGFLKGKMAMEDDSILLGYHYYLGTRNNWRPKINFNAMCVHDVAAQRLNLDIDDGGMENLRGLVLMYGAMGLRKLAGIHSSYWHQKFFNEEYERIKASV
jgi:hypothetical protein